MPDFKGLLRRMVLGPEGRAFRPGLEGARSWRIRAALPMLAPDALSSVAYAPDEIIGMLAAAGMAGVLLAPWVGVAIALLMAVLVASYRQTIKAFPSGGDYAVAKARLGPVAGVTVGGAMMVDSLLMVAVSVSSGAHYLASVVPWLEDHVTVLALVVVGLVALAALRGAKAVGAVMVVAVYGFIGVLGLTAAVGGIQALVGELPKAASADLDLATSSQFDHGLATLASAFLVLRAFSSGAVALTGVQTVAQGTPLFRQPSQKTAGRALMYLGLACGGLLLGVLVLANKMHVVVADNPATELLGPDGQPLGPDYLQAPVLAQIIETVFRSVPPVYVIVIVVVAGLLILAASSAFRWVPALMSLLAQDAYLPKQFYRRGDRRMAAHAILTLGLGSGLLIWLFDASVNRLIQLYVVGVFVSFTLSQLAMVRHWNGLLRLAKSAAERRKLAWARAVNATGFGLTAVALAVVVITKFTHGAWVTLLLLGLALWAMLGIHRHYALVDRETAIALTSDQSNALPSRVHALVLVSAWNLSTARAVAYARATRPSTIQAVSVCMDHGRMDTLRSSWEAANVPVPLRLMDAPSREITRPIITFVTALRRRAPRDLVVLYIPEKVVGHWWERYLHNRSAARLTSRLRRVPGVVIAMVPWQLDSAQHDA